MGRSSPNVDKGQTAYTDVWDLPKTSWYERIKNTCWKELQGIWSQFSGSRMNVTTRPSRDGSGTGNGQRVSGLRLVDTLSFKAYTWPRCPVFVSSLQPWTGMGCSARAGFIWSYPTGVGVASKKCAEHDVGLPIRPNVTFRKQHIQE